MKVLIAEDNKLIMYSISLYLKKIGYDVTESYDGNECINLLKTENFDLLVLDIFMPSLSGFDIIEELRENLEMNKDIPILVISAGNHDVVIKSLNLGADEYMQKPINLKELAIRLKNIIK